MYGKELILDLYDCDPTTFNRKSIEEWLEQLCDSIDMQREDLHFWDYEDELEEKAKALVHLIGTSAVQFITTSDIVIHTVDMIGECYINVFSCKDFDTLPTVDFTKEWFKANQYEYRIVTRGRMSEV